MVDSHGTNTTWTVLADLNLNLDLGIYLVLLALEGILFRKLAMVPSTCAGADSLRRDVQSRLTDSFVHSSIPTLLRQHSGSSAGSAQALLGAP
jgi:hypothetical protein